MMNRQLWKYWCKAMGSHAYDDEEKDDHVHLTIRTFWFLLHIVTCLFIIIGNEKVIRSMVNWCKENLGCYHL